MDEKKSQYIKREKLDLLLDFNDMNSIYLMSNKDVYQLSSPLNKYTIFNVFHGCFFFPFSSDKDGIRTTNELVWWGWL